MKTVPTLLASSRPGIPVRRYGTVPELDVPETVYEMEPLHAGRTIAERGGLAVFVAALTVGCIGAWLLYF